MSKGDKQRPTDYTKYSENYDRIFGPKPEKDKDAFEQWAEGLIEEEKPLPAS